MSMIQMKLKIIRYDINDWKRYKIGIYGFGEPEPHVEEHIKNCLADGRKVRSLLVARKDIVTDNNFCFSLF